MGLFNRFNKNKTDGASNASADAWQKVGKEVPFAGRSGSVAGATSGQAVAIEPVENETQQAKLIAALLSGDSNQLARQDITVHLGARQEYMERITRGEITLEDKKRLLLQIASPREKYGAEGVMNGIVYDGQTGKPMQVSGIGDNRQMRRILSMTTGAGFDDFDGMGAQDVNKFWAKYPTPADFEAASEEFLGMIQEANSLQKYQEYQRSMAQFKKVMFGKRQEYWDQMKLLDKEAKLRSGQTEELQRPEQVADYEVLADKMGSYIVSRAQVKQGLMRGERMSDDETSQDGALVMPDRGLFGVFDGVGGMHGGRLASQTAVETIKSMSEKEVHGGQDLCEMLDAASMAINRTEGAGASTGTLIKIQQTSERQLMTWASVGDSRVYVVDKNGQAVQLSQDEGYENKITNSLGGPGPERRARQIGRYSLQKGDRVVLCSDGITGDKGADLMRAEELGMIVHRAQTAEAAVQELVDNARKVDDRTALVIEI